MFGQDYLFYRMYRWHKKKKWTPVPDAYAFRFISAIHLAYILVFSLFINFFICDLFFDETDFWIVFPYLFIGLEIIDFILLNRRYNDEKVAALEKKYRKDRRNKVIGNWMILLAFPLSFPVAFFLAQILLGGKPYHIFGYEIPGLLGWLIAIFHS
ncbi:MAG: hypothetical protein LBJ72_04720 [Dysgonamonadaceae bacterium]|jgi:hypothetical protein|nr:hypothetical protein [Dysgonamonadaceae bacterium]